MPFTHSHLSLPEWKEDVWECFLFIEKKFPLFPSFEFPDSCLIGEKLLDLIYYTPTVGSLASDQLKQFALFMIFLLKSTLLFDRSFSLDMKHKESKLILMHADLYLIQGGIEFNKLHQHQKCQLLLEETLNFLSTHYLSSFDQVQKTLSLQEILSQRYGALVYCAIVGILLLSDNTTIPKKALFSFSRAYGLYLCIKNHKLLHSTHQDPTLLNKQSQKLLSLLSKNAKELAFLQYLSSDFERKAFT